MVATHQTWRDTRSAAGMPGSSGASPAPGATVTARKPQMPQIKPFCGVMGNPVSRETPASRSGKAGAGDRLMKGWLKGSAASHRQGPIPLLHVHGPELAFCRHRPDRSLPPHGHGRGAVS